MGFRNRSCFNNVRLIMARMNVYEIIVWYSVFGLSRRAIGIRVIVAIKIFSIIKG